VVCGPTTTPIVVKEWYYTNLNGQTDKTDRTNKLDITTEYSSTSGGPLYSYMLLLQSVLTLWYLAAY